VAHVSGISVVKNQSTACIIDEVTYGITDWQTGSRAYSRYFKTTSQIEKDYSTDVL